MVKNGQNGQKLSKMFEMGKMVQNGPNWSKRVQMVKNGQKWQA